jgi:hypothetical protein
LSVADWTSTFPENATVKASFLESHICRKPEL